MNDSEYKNGGYGKKSIWYWIVLYVIVAIVVYGAVFFIYKAVKNQNASDSSTTTTDSLY